MLTTPPVDQRGVATWRGEPTVCRASTPALARAVLAGAAVGTLGYVVIDSRVLGGVGLLLLLVAAATVPVASTLSGRLALVGTAVLGWTPLLWWIHWPGRVDHGAVVVALLTGGTAAWAASRDSVRHALAGLRPTVRWVDGVPVATGLSALGLMARFVTPSSPRAALTQLLPGFDNAAHFGMFELLRTHGDAMGRVPSPDGSAWYYGAYPQGFHQVVATLADVSGHAFTSSDHELVVYAHSIAVLVVATMVCLSAAFCSVPALRREPVAAALAAYTVAVALLWGPGGGALPDGFASFWFASALVSIVVVLSLGVEAQRPVTHIVAVGGAVVGIAYAWAPLVLLALATLPGVVRAALRRGLRPRRGSLLASVVVGAACLVAVGRLLLGLTSGVGVTAVVSAGGGITPPNPTLLLFTIVLAPCAAVMCVRLKPRGGSPSGRRLAERATWLGVVSLAGIGSAAVLCAMQLRSSGSLGYYFFKYCLAVELASITVITVQAVALRTSFRESETARSQSRGLAAAAGVAVLVLAPTALTWGHWEPELVKADRVGTAPIGSVSEREVLARQILAAKAVSQHWSHPAVLLTVARSPGAAAVNGHLPEAWRLALTGGWTEVAQQRSAGLWGSGHDAEDIASAVGRALRRDGRVVVLVPPQELAMVRAHLATGTQRARVVSWAP